MAANSVISDSTKDICRDRDRYLKMMREAGEGLRHVLDTLTQMSDGARDAAADFDLIATQGGYQAGDYATVNDAAKKTYDELNSVVGTYETATKAAVAQACAIHGLS